jgi:hypothetical protein
MVTIGRERPVDFSVGRDMSNLIVCKKGSIQVFKSLSSRQVVFQAAVVVILARNDIIGAGEIPTF